MPRIIAGRAGSIALDVPETGTRPTSDRVRESLFGALESADAVRGAAVLDLYAGSGALGLEAASRGAASVDLVEKSARAAAVIQRNADRVRRALDDAVAVRLHRAGVVPYLRSAIARWDVALLDPPYDVAAAEVTDVLTLLVPRLNDNATVVLERASRSDPPRPPGQLRAIRHRRYGDTTLWWLRLEAGTDQPSVASQSR